MPRKSSDYSIEIPVSIKDNTRAGAKSTNSSVDRMAQQAKRDVEQQMSSVEQLQRQRSSALIQQWSRDESAKTKASQQAIKERERAEQQSQQAVQSLQRQRSSALIQGWKQEQAEFAKSQKSNIAAAEEAAARQTAAAESSWNTVRMVVAAAVVGIAVALGAAIVQTTLFAGRTQELTIALHQMAKANNISTEDIDKQLRGLMGLNIARQDATQILAQMIAANLDLSKATTLARVAQDTAVISGKNSSEAFKDLTQAILMGTTQSFRAAGIYLSVRKELDEGAKALGKNRAALSEHERQQILTNAVVAYGARLQGTYEAAMGSASKQMRSLTRVAQDAEQAFGDMFQGAFMVGVTVTRALLETIAKYPAPLLLATTAVLAFGAAVLLASTSAVPGLISTLVSLVSMLKLVGQVMIGTASLIQGAAATTAVMTLGWGAAILAVIALVYAMSQMNDVVANANRISLEHIEKQGKELEASRELAKAAEDVAAAQAGSSDQHSKLNTILGALDPATKAYVEALTSEEDRVKTLNKEIARTVELKKTSLEASVSVLAGAINEQAMEVKAKEANIESNQQIINQNNEMMKQGKGLGEGFNRLTSVGTVKLQESIDTLNTSLKENHEKMIATGKALGWTTQQFVEHLQATKMNSVQVDILGKMYEGLTPKIDSTNQALKEQAEDLKAVQKELRGLLDVGDLEIESKILEIVKGAKNAAEARRMAQEALKGTPRSSWGGTYVDNSLKSLIDQRESNREKEKAAREVLEPKPPTKASIERGTRDAEMRAAMRKATDELAADFQEEFGRAMRFHFGGGKIHAKQGWDHSAAADITEDARTAEGQFVLEWAKAHGIHAQFSPGPSKNAAGMITSTGMHIHFGETSGAKALGLKVNENLLSDRGLSKYLETESLVFESWTGKMVSQAQYNKDRSAIEKARRAVAPIETPEPQIIETLGPDMERKWDNYYKDMNAREKALKDRRKDFADEYLATQTNMATEIGNLELDLDHLRKQAADDQFTEQRRLLSAKQEEVDLTKRITQAEDDLANGPINESLRVQLALIQDINQIRSRDEAALKDYNRAILEMADATVYHAQQADTSVAKFLASQKSVTEIVSDAKIGVMQTTFDLMDRGLAKVTNKLGIMKDLVHQIIAGFLRLALSQFFKSVFLGQSSSAGGGGGAAGIFSTVFGGAGNAQGQTPGIGGGGGGPGQQTGGALSTITGAIRNYLTGGGSTATPIPPSASGVPGGGTGTTWANIASKIGFPGQGGAGGGLLASLKTSLGPMLPFLGMGLGAQAGGQSRFGSIIGGIGGLALGGTGAALLSGGMLGAMAGNGIFAAGGMFGSMGPMIAGFLTNPFTIAAAGALIIGAIIASKNAARRKDETARNTISNDTGTAIWALIDKARLGDITQAEADAEWNKISTDYHTRIAAIKDGKTRRNAELQWTNDFMPLKKILDTAVSGSITRANTRNRMSPVFAGGGFTDQDELIKVRPGEGIKYPGTNIIHTVFGRDMGYDTQVMYAPKGTRIINQSDMRSSRPMQTGGTVGGGSTDGVQELHIDSIEVNIDADGLATAVVSSRVFGKAVVHEVKVGKKKKVA